MKKPYETPKLVVHGKVEEITQTTKRLGTNDNLIQIVNEDGTPSDITIGS